MKALIANYLSTRFGDVRSLSEDEVRSKRDNASYAFEGTTDISGERIVLQIAFKDDFPLSKPLFFLKEPNILGFIPHVEPDGYICYIHDEGLVMDIDNPSGIVEYCLAKVISVLLEGKTGQNRLDFINEFEAYWRNLQGAARIKSFLSLESRVVEISLCLIREQGVDIVGHNQADIDRLAKRFFGQFVTIENTLVPAVFVPLESAVMPPPYDKPWTISDLKRIINDNLSRQNRKRFQKHLKKNDFRATGVEYLVLAMPLPNGNYAVFGIRIASVDSPNRARRFGAKVFHPLRIPQSKIELTPLQIERLDKDYLVPRSGGYLSVSGKTVLIIGCGAVGSHLAFELARAGISTLGLVDNDRMKPENIYRHALGIDSVFSYEVRGDEYHEINQLKAQTLKARLEEAYPFLDVHARVETIEALLGNKEIKPSDYDLVVVALGNPTMELYLNRYFHNTVGGPPVIFTWVEPLGIGGHALLSRPGRHGCFECLFLDPNDENAPLYNRASFAAPNQFFGKSLLGCGSVFTPYGSADAVQTAILAAKLGINALLGIEKDNPLLSWKGEAETFLTEGFRLSSRYDQSVETLFKNRYIYKSSKCPICGGDPD